MLRVAAILALVAVATAKEWEFGEFTFKSTSKCSFLPMRPGMAPPHPPPLINPCEADDFKCPAAPGQCYEDSQCSWGECSEHVMKRSGSTCDDDKPWTTDDVCHMGSCSGVEFACPASQELQLKGDNSRARAYWNAPVALMHGFEFTVTGTHRSGAGFSAGSTEVIYTAATDGPTGAMVVECSFFVTVKDSCDTECCGRSDDDYPRAVVRDGPNFGNNNGDLSDAYDLVFEQRDSVTCVAGKSVCDQPLAYLPTRIAMPPPQPPKHFSGPRDGSGITTPAPTRASTTSTLASTRASTTASTTSTRASTTASPTTRESTTSAPTTRADTTVCIARKCRCRPDAFEIYTILDNGCEDCACSRNPPASTTTMDTTTSSTTTARTTTEAASTTTSATTRAPTAQAPDTTSVAASTGRQVFTELCVGRISSLTSTSCRCDESPNPGLQNCHTCEFDDGSHGECTLCKNNYYYLDGVCVATCPDGMEAAGTGKFGRVCLTVASTTTTAAPTSAVTTVPATTTEPAIFDVCKGKTLKGDDSACRCDKNCHTCHWNGQDAGCKVCKNTAFLLEGVCVNACPDGYIGIGSGAFNGYCQVVDEDAIEETCEGKTTSVSLTTCTCKENKDCHTCSWNGSAGTCSRCKNEKYLFDGSCLGDCPDGFVNAGSGKFSRECKSEGRRRRSIPAAHAAP